MAAANNVRLSAERQFDSVGFNRKVMTALSNANGSVTDAAKALGVSRRTLCRWIEENRELQRTVKDERGRIKHHRAKFGRR